MSGTDIDSALQPKELWHSTTTLQVLAGRDLAPKSGHDEQLCVLISTAIGLQSSPLDSKQQISSEAINYTPNPQWTTAILTINNDIARVLRVEVWSKDSHKSAESLVGFAIVELDPFIDVKEKWIPLNTGQYEIQITILREFFHQNTINNINQKLVHMYLSATFFDMLAERENLRHNMMVEFQRFCYDHGVTLTYTDMRWGITDEQAKNKLTITRCLQGIDRTRPYFVGLLGERYGWHQEVDGQDALLTQSFETAEALPEYKWVQNFRTSSVMELEILHAFLYHQHLSQGHVFFYLRDPSYYSTISSADISKFVDQSPYAIRKLKELKDAIKANKGCVVREYKDPYALAQLVLEDLKASIERDYPLSVAGDLQRAHIRHEHYAHHQCSVYYPCDKYFYEIESGISEDKLQGNYVLVEGKSGAGKSILLANWWKKQIEAALRPTIIHFVGASIHASNFDTIIMRLFGEINCLLGENALPIPKTSLLTHSIYSFLLAASQKGGITIILDGINQLHEQYHDLRWLPDTLPPLVNIILSTSSASGDIANEKKVKVVPLLPLTLEDKKLIISSQLTFYGKHISTENLEKVTQHDLSYSPIFLKTVIAEMCSIGYYTNFQHQLEVFLHSTDLPLVFKAIISRWEEDFGAITKEVLLLILCSRNGLPEFVIHSITKAPVLQFHPLMAVMRPTLTIQYGNLNFSHEYIRQAVAAYYPGPLTQYYEKLAEYWQKEPFSIHVAFEYPWILSRLIESSIKAQQDLSELLLDLNNFNIFYYNDRLKGEVYKYWQQLEKIDSKWNLGNQYQQRVNEAETPLSPKLVADISEFLISAGHLQNVQSIISKYLPTLQSTHEQIVKLLNVLGKSFRKQGKLTEAMELHKKARALSIELKNPGLTAQSLKHIANTYHAMRKYVKALNRFTQALEIKMQALGEALDRAAATIINNLAYTFLELGQFDKAVEQITKSFDLRMQLFGENHTSVATSLYNISHILIRQKNLPLALLNAKKSHSTHVKLLGETHPRVAHSLTHLAYIRNVQGKFESAFKYNNKALAIFKRLYGESHPLISIALNNLGDSYKHLGNLDQAVDSFTKSLEIQVNLFGEIHPDTARIRDNLGRALYAQGKVEEAAEQFYAVQDIRESL